MSLGVIGHEFVFGPDFYQPNDVLSFSEKSGEVFLNWPQGASSPMIAVDRDHLIDRSYWISVIVERDSTGNAVALVYDRFRGPIRQKEN
jgi:hypothetical protein